jgi:hypothetical protein
MCLVLEIELNGTFSEIKFPIIDGKCEYMEKSRLVVLKKTVSSTFML